MKALLAVVVLVAGCGSDDTHAVVIHGVDFYVQDDAIIDAQKADRVFVEVQGAVAYYYGTFTFEDLVAKSPVTVEWPSEFSGYSHAGSSIGVSSDNGYQDLGQFLVDYVAEKYLGGTGAHVVPETMGAIRSRVKARVGQI